MVGQRPMATNIIIAFVVIIVVAVILARDSRVDSQ
jgi:hypothetical protein